MLSAAILAWAMPGIIGSVITNPLPWTIFTGCLLAAGVVVALLARRTDLGWKGKRLFVGVGLLVDVTVKKVPGGEVLLFAELFKSIGRFLNSSSQGFNLLHLLRSHFRPSHFIAIRFHNFGVAKCTKVC